MSQAKHALKLIPTYFFIDNFIDSYKIDSYMLMLYNFPSSERPLAWNTVRNYSILSKIVLGKVFRVEIPRKIGEESQDRESGDRKILSISQTHIAYRFI
jgi:hypothetical protein